MAAMMHYAALAVLVEVLARWHIFSVLPLQMNPFAVQWPAVVPLRTSSNLWIGY